MAPPPGRFDAALAPRSAQVGDGGREIRCSGRMWHALVSGAIMRGTGTHSITFKITEIPKGGSSCVGMGAPSQDMSETIGMQLANSVGLSSGGVLCANGSLVPGGLQQCKTGDEVRLEYASNAPHTLAFYLNRAKVDDWEGVGDGWHFAVAGFTSNANAGTNAFAIVDSSAAQVPA